MDINNHSGSKFSYSFKILPDIAIEDDVAAYCVKTRAKFAVIAKKFDDDLNTEWIVRNYLAIKYIFAASIILGTAIYGEKKNVISTLPYCIYYALLYSCRAFLFTIPDFDWKGIKSIEKTHSSILNLTETYLRRLDSEKSVTWAKTLKKAQAQRELYSYRFPTSGLAFIKGDAVQLCEAEELCQLLTDLAKLNSDCLESALRKHNPGKFRVVEGDAINLAMTYEMEGIDNEDPDDYYRIGYHVRKFSTVSNLAFMATDGLRDDYAISWSAADRHGDDAFNPDDYMYLLLSY
ncbi:hypothetical protein [Brucella thiophenivorans]|uniref:Uncharacterized protein n=1 Tax=Brucella thiophenivorans TaxID=571255 RepID=A0A256FV30_9HYPH|nr:hypothetical protein [Brucella thiophenivorans]OYR18281.1 hypothetical protein CEV31_4293 [Brucella thiophenivorans]